MSIAQSGYLTRVELGLSQLEIVAGPVYMTSEGLSDIGVVWRRQTVSSPFVDGTFDVAAVRDQSSRAVEFAVTGQDYPSIRFNTLRLTEALSQYDYEFHLFVDGFENSWRCDRADYTVSLTAGHVLGHVCLVRATIPMRPVPLVGPY